LLASIWLEKKGIPTLALCTDAFATVLATLAEIHGRADKQWASIPHPFGSLDDTVVWERAQFFVGELYRAALTAE
jgi:hypothetical protein